ncbi:chorismate-binding protein [Thermaurantiacus sp.]
MAAPGEFPAQPFALFPRAGGRGLLFSAPVACIEARALEDVEPALARARGLAREGLHLAGGLAYEAAAAFEQCAAQALARHVQALEEPLLWFGAFPAPSEVELAALPGWERLADWGEPLLAIDAKTHGAAVARLQAWIAAGDIYQANLTFGCKLPVWGHPVALFARLFAQAPAPHAALVFTGRHWWLSLSPERFFALKDGMLRAAPMKGTAARPPLARDDHEAARALAADPKNRAENLMITDLIRNDCARVAAAGSVRVPRAFAIESQPYVHQMVSHVEAQLAHGLDAFDALKALFPCGSITGAPKLRAIELLAEAEPRPRGLYCGAIGTIGPDAASADFAVAIRTLVIAANKPEVATLGLGSGIVADSKPAAEWRECLAKARFLERRTPESLIETMRREADGRVPLLARHLARMAASASRFAIPFEPSAADALLARLPARGAAERVRLLLSAAGALAVEAGPAPAPPPVPVTLALAPLPLPPDDWRLFHKSSDRSFYDAARQAAGAFEVAFVRADGFVTEGSFTSLFVARDGALVTPPVHRGLLPGVLRAELLASGQAVEGDLAAADLVQASQQGRLFIGNALRGLIPAILAS